MEEKDVIDEIVEETIKNFDEMPFGITDDEIETQEEIKENGDNNEDGNTY